MHSSNPLAGKSVAILATDGFEQSELTEPKKMLSQAGATVHVVSPEAGQIKGWNMTQWGEDVNVDRVLEDVSAEDYDALVLPGGLFNPDSLRQDEDAVEFVKGFFNNDENKPVAAICHGPWLLAEAEVIKDRTLTSYPSIRTDISNAGGKWVDAEVVEDRGMITSRKPGDLDAFNETLIAAISAKSAAA